MPLSNNDITLIEKYLDDDLSADENDVFNSRIQDTAFTEELKLQQSTANALKHLFEQQLKEELRQQLGTYRQDELDSKKTTSRFNKTYFYWAAAAIAFVIIFILAIRQKSTSDEALYLTYYKPYHVGNSTRSLPASNNHLAFEKYTEGDFQQAAILLEQLLKDNTQGYNTALLQLLLGNCYLNTGELQKAVASLKSAANSDDPILSQHAKWYSALALLKLGNRSETLRLLQELTSSDSIYQKQAGNLMDELKNTR
jgi:tetratricopeptide (TPR) repeat protein